MRRLACSTLLLLSCVYTASAALAEQAALPASATLAASVSSAASGVAASGTLAADTEKQRGPVISYLIRKFGVARQKAEKIADAVTIASVKYSLPPAVLLAIISTESRFREKARGGNGATGLMQVVPSAHRALIRNQDLTEPTTNIRIGSAILYGYMQGANGDLDTAMRHYGGGAAYAERIRVRAREFDRVLDIDTQPQAASDAQTLDRRSMSRSR